MATPVLQFKRGAFSNLPALKAGEPGFTTDKYELYIGLDNVSANNKFFGSHRYWTRETASAGSGINLVESTAGTDFITLAAPASVGAAVTFYFPAIQGGSNTVLLNDGNGNLSWGSGSANPVFIGISTFSDTTDNTLGNPNTGAVQIDGGLGVDKNVTVGAGLSVVGNVYVAGISTFVGAVTFEGGTITLGDAASDNVVFAADVNSNIIPNTDATYDFGTGSQRWRNGSFSGIVTATTFSGDLALANITGLGANVATFLATPSSANLASAVSDETGTGALVFANTPTLVTPVLGNASASSLNISGITTTGTLILSGTSGIGITGISTSTTLAENSNNYLPTQAAVKAYVDAVDVTTSLAGDSGTGSVSTSQTLTVAGTANEIETAVSGQTITVGLPNAVVVGTSLSAPTVITPNIQASDGTSAITITNGTGAVGISSNLTVTGNLSVLGSQTIVNTETLKVEDSLIEIGLINSSGSLVAPTSDLNIDIGVLFHYFSGSARKAAVFWDDSASRIVFADEVTESSSVLTVAANAYASIEVESIFINDCAGQSQLITCTGSTRNLENITIDGGSF